MDIEKIKQAMERPRELLYAFWLTMASLAFGAILFPLKSMVVKSQFLAFTIVGFGISLIFTLFIFFMILRGKNWARLMYLNFFVCAAPFAFPAVVVAFQKSPVLAVIRLLQLALQIMAGVLLLQKPCRNWFKILKLRRLMNYQLT